MASSRGEMHDWYYFEKDMDMIELGGISFSVQNYPFLVNPVTRVMRGAKDFCAELGMRLVVINSAEKQEIVQRYLETFYPQ